MRAVRVKQNSKVAGQLNNEVKLALQLCKADGMHHHDQPLLTLYLHWNLMLS